MDGGVAALDIGKTNIKVLGFERGLNIVAELSRANRALPAGPRFPYLHLDTDGAWAFLIDALSDIAAKVRIDAISITTHGAAGVLVDEAGAVLAPLDYEWEGLEADAEAYSRLRPPFAQTLSPNLQRGLNLGRQLFHFFRHYPAEAALATAFLTYPQYWAWRLTGMMASETTSLGCHTDLWRPREADFSTLVESQGWRKLFPPLRRAWERLGCVRPGVADATGLRRDVQVLCGAHDSNAALVPYLATRSDPFTVISTGTWVVIMAVGGTGALDPAADMLANVDVRGKPIPCARFMGGREFATLAGADPPPVSVSDVAALVAAGTFAAPSFSEQGGPFAGRIGRIEGPAPSDGAGHGALATLYCALVTAYLVERLQAPGDLIVEGGFARAPAFAGVLAALMPGRRVLEAASASGAAEGAALLARWGETVAPPRTRPVELWPIDGLIDYRARWSELAGV